MSSISEEANKLADFILFTQRSCILNLSSELNEGKVSYPQFFLLTYLASEDFLSMSSIAQKMGHSTAAATGMVDKLQEMGYLKRMSAAKDRRKIMVAIPGRARSGSSHAPEHRSGSGSLDGRSGSGRTPDACRYRKIHQKAPFGLISDFSSRSLPEKPFPCCGEVLFLSFLF